MIVNASTVVLGIHAKLILQVVALDFCVLEWSSKVVVVKGKSNFCLIPINKTTTHWISFVGILVKVD